MKYHVRSTRAVSPSLREDTHKKKVFFLVIGPLRFYPPYSNGLVVHGRPLKKTFFLCVSSLSADKPVIIILATTRLISYIHLIPLVGLIVVRIVGLTLNENKKNLDNTCEKGEKI